MLARFSKLFCDFQLLFSSQNLFLGTSDSGSIFSRDNAAQNKTGKLLLRKKGESTSGRHQECQSFQEASIHLFSQSKTSLPIWINLNLTITLVCSIPRECSFIVSSTLEMEKFLYKI